MGDAAAFGELTLRRVNIPEKLQLAQQTLVLIGIDHDGGAAPSRPADQTSKPLADGLVLSYCR